MYVNNTIRKKNVFKIVKLVTIKLNTSFYDEIKIRDENVNVTVFTTMQGSWRNAHKKLKGVLTQKGRHLLGQVG